MYVYADACVCVHIHAKLVCLACVYSIYGNSNGRGTCQCLNRDRCSTCDIIIMQLRPRSWSCPLHSAHHVPSALGMFRHDHSRRTRQLFGGAVRVGCATLRTVITLESNTWGGALRKITLSVRTRHVTTAP